MRKVFLSLLLFMLLVSHVCSADAYAEERKTINDLTRVMESYITAVESSDAVKTMIQAINDLAVKLETLIPKMKEMAEKNPDWGDSPPDELKESMDRYVEVSKKFFMESLFFGVGGFGVESGNALLLVGCENHTAIDYQIWTQSVNVFIRFPLS